MFMSIGTLYISQLMLKIEVIYVYSSSMLYFYS